MPTTVHLTQQDLHAPVAGAVLALGDSGAFAEVNPMKTILVCSVLLIAACGWARSAVGGFVAFGSYSIEGAITDNLGHSSHVYDHSPPVLESKDPKTGLIVTKTLGTSVGSSTTVGDFTLFAQPGKLGIYASAGAVASIQDPRAFQEGASTGTHVSVGLIDDWTFHLRHPVGRIRVDASFELDSNLVTDAHGVLSKGANLGRDHVDSAASVLLRISGAGIPNGPFKAHTLDCYGFSEQRNDSVHVFRDDADPPATVPVSLAVKGDKTSVLFIMSVDVGAGVSAWDIVNHASGNALAIGNLSHTLSWGGITRLTDLDTGEVITDWSMTSASGFDYSRAAAAVPEPASLLLLVPGLGAWLALVVLRQWWARGPGG
jgi:hypothetical protein